MFIKKEYMKGCDHPEHAPPPHIHVPEDKVYIHECPRCGTVTRMISPNTILDWESIKAEAKSNG